MDFPGHFQHIFKQLNHQRLHGQLCDCVVVVGGQRFPAHRSILAASSSHFRALLSSVDEGSGAQGGGGGGRHVMELDPEVVTPEAFSTLLDMIYTSTLSLGASNEMDVLLAASHLHLNAVVKACKLRLSRKNFPASAPKGWRSVQEQLLQSPSVPQLQVTSAMGEDSEIEDMGMEVTQSGEDENRGFMGRSEQFTTRSLRQKRKSNDEMLRDKKRTFRYKEGSPTVTRSTEEGGDDLTPSVSLKTTGRHWDNQGDDKDEEEEKYDATKGDLEEIQLPTQSDSSTAGTDGDPVVKVQQGEEEQDEPKILIEVKTESMSSYSNNLDTIPNNSPPSPLEAQIGDGKLTIAEQAEADGATLSPQPCIDLTGTEDLSGDAVDGEGLDSFSELAFSCFLNTSTENIMEGLGEEDTLASLTAAATAAAAASDTPAAPESPTAQSQKSKEESTSSLQAPGSSSSLVFPVATVALQQILPTQSCGFSDTIILQPSQNSLAGFLSGIRPNLSLDTTLVQPKRAGKSSGPPTFRRIAPKVVPVSESSTEASSGTPGDGIEPPSLTRASEDVLSKCKKAAAEDDVLLVEGEKKYACKMCCKTFMNLTDCKKHIRVHTGEKPYPCPKCGKCFSQSSHLYKHSKNTCMNWKDNQAFSDSLL